MQTSELANPGSQFQNLRQELAQALRKAISGSYETYAAVVAMLDDAQAFLEDNAVIDPEAE